MLGQRVATGVSQMCLQEREWGWESEKGTRLVPAGGGTFGRRIRTFHREKKEEHKKNTQKQTLPWKMVGRGGEPRWARERRCRRKAGRLGAGELGLERSSVTAVEES